MDSLALNITISSPSALTQYVRACVLQLQTPVVKVMQMMISQRDWALRHLTNWSYPMRRSTLHFNIIRVALDFGAWGNGATQLMLN